MFNYDSDALRELSRERADELARAYRQAQPVEARDSRSRDVRRRRARVVSFLARMRVVDRAASEA
jgi:hypothetical protein